MFFIISLSLTNSHVRHDLDRQRHCQRECLRRLRGDDRRRDRARRGGDATRTRSHCGTDRRAFATTGDGADCSADRGATDHLLRPVPLPPAALTALVLIDSTLSPTCMSVSVTLMVAWPFILLPLSTALTMP